MQSLDNKTGFAKRWAKPAPEKGHSGYAHHPGRPNKAPAVLRNLSGFAHGFLLAFLVDHTVYHHFGARGDIREHFARDSVHIFRMKQTHPCAGDSFPWQLAPRRF